MSGELTEPQRELLDIVTGPDTPPDWWADHQKLALVADYMMNGPNRVFDGNDIVYLLEKPWKHTADYVEACRWNRTRTERPFRGSR